MKTAIIIEDEPKAAQELQGILKKLRNDIIVIKTIESIEESVAWLQTNESPDIIFSDIQLSDGISFDIFRKIKNIAPIIFCTAFDAYMQKAFEV
ncbi:MAG: response regulator, partial [Cyclobacteriaceae bacterium]|nr:response regulator [Cyclobacteriaceae bacterium]